MLILRTIALTAFLLVITSACSSDPACQDNGGGIGSHCAAQLLKGLHVPSVDGYELKAIYPEHGGSAPISISMQYAPRGGDRPLVVVTAFQGAGLPNLIFPATAVVNGHPVGFGDEMGSSDSAYAEVDGVVYEVEVLLTPGDQRADADRARAAFVDSITRGA